jgi:NADH-quinone oxidoreductase subunit F
VLLGGAAGLFVGPDALDLPLTFEGVRAAGATLGSGVVLVLDDTVPVPELLRRITRFFRDESCGQCVPCRVGTVRQEELVARLIAGPPAAGLGGTAAADPGGTAAADLALLDDIGAVTRDASICGLGQTALSAVQSAVKLGLIGTGS